ncbi:ABC transporter ATP-binding protein [Litchfieldella xinjiangensis]|uniref:ABC transporter ATP-binding protein n=1 Tax=Litchfieldella xinjiangensis TaxID=1166948 RepID=UPI0005BA2DDE|nr:ABC transporter ATP-binding protein [Halomonas xinjiangensis]
MAALVLDSLVKRFESTPVVDELSLEIEPGEFVALLGPSGCGKTTTLRLLAGFETLSSGQVSLNGRSLAHASLHLPPEQRRMGMVFQSYALWPHMSVADNVGYTLKMRHIKGDEYRRRVGQALETVQLASLAERMPQALSGGQRQRVALARCLVTEPEVVLLDEPLANLDRHLRASMEETFREFHRRTGATMVYVTHDQSEAMSLADRIAVMKSGRLAQWATPETLYRRPRNEWVARFIGQGSILRLPDVTPGRAIPGAELMSLAMHHECEWDTPVLVRPEQVRLGSTGLPARVENCIFRGERYELWLCLNSGQRLFAYHHEALPIGREVRLVLQQGWSLEPEA